MHLIWIIFGEVCFERARFELNGRNSQLTTLYLEIMFLTFKIDKNLNFV